MKPPLADLDFGEIFSESVNKVATVVLLKGVSEGIYTEAFNAVCKASKLDAEKTTIKDLSKHQKAELLRRVVLIALHRGHGRKQIFSILSRSGVTSEKMQVKIWNSAVKAETNRVFEQVFGVNPDAVEPKSVVSHILKGDHDNFIHSTKTKKTNLLGAIGFGPYVDLCDKIKAFKAKPECPDDATPEQIEKYNADHTAQYDAIIKEREELFETVNELAAEVNDTIKKTFGSKDRVSRGTDDFTTDDQLLAAMTIGGKVIEESDLEDEEDSFAV